VFSQHQLDALLGRYRFLVRDTRAAALMEFAIALPLLVVLVVGIFDFGGAFNLKQELNNAMREGARFGASQPSNDLGLTLPPSVNSIRFLVDSYLQTAHINDCGLNTAGWALSSGFTWQFNASGNGCSLTLTVNRQNVVQEIIGGNQVYMPCTTVQISYPYQWHFNNVIQLLAPGEHYTLGNIQSNATAMNMD
jgi:Flp pilus assembly protein TadG